MPIFDNFFKRFRPSAEENEQATAIVFPQAITITDSEDIFNHIGKFVKLEIANLTNWHVSILKVSDQLFSAPEAKLNRALAEPLTELRIYKQFDIKIEAISTIPAKDYEDSHYIYGILRKKPSEFLVLTKAFIKISDRNLQIIKNELEQQEMFEYSILDDGTVSVFNFSSFSVENLAIPEKINGRMVSAISRDAFAENQSIKSVAIPNTVKSIDYGAFTSCDKLECVCLGDGVKTLETAFDVCQELKKVHIGKALSTIVDSFHNCRNLSAIDVDPENKYLCAIDGVLFSKDRSTLVFCPCGKKGKYTIPIGTKVIGTSAFACTELEEIIIPNTVEKIEYDAFGWAGGIKKLTIPSSVKDIDYNAISAGVGDFEGEIIIEQGSYAQQYFQDFYEEDDYKLVVLDKHQPQGSPMQTPAEIDEKLFCRRCGTQLPLDSDFCFKCGTKVEKEVL